MNSYTFDTLHTGLSHSFTSVVTQESMDLFCRLTGDTSPIHISDDAAKARGHQGRVVYGMLGASLFSTLAGVYLPGETCLLHGVEAKFVRPIYVGDTLTITGTVQEINETYGQITIKAHIANQLGQKVIRGVIKAGVHTPKEA